MQGICTIRPVGTYADHERATADVGQCDEIVSEIVNAVELPLEVQALALTNAFVNNPLNTSQSVDIGRDTKPHKKWMHDQQGTYNAFGPSES